MIHVLASVLALAPQGFASEAPRVSIGIRPLAFAAAPTGSRVALTLEDGSVRIIDAATRQTVRQLARHPQPAYAIAWSPNGNLLATGDESGRVWVQDTSGKMIRQYRTHQRGVQKLSFNSASSLLASTGKDDVIRLYRPGAAALREWKTIPGNGANFFGAAFHPSQPTQFTTGILGAGARVFSTATAQSNRTLTAHDNQGVFDIAYNRAGTRLATAGRDGTASVWDTRTWRRVAGMRGHGDWVVFAAFSPNGRLLATGSTDRTVRIWNSTNGQSVLTLENQSFVGSPVAFTADGRFLLTVNDSGSLMVTALRPAQR